MCLLLELYEAFIWAEISEAGNSNELILCSRGTSNELVLYSRGNSGSSFPVAILMKTSFIIALEETLKIPEKLIVLKYMWTAIALCLFELFLPQYGLCLLPNRAFFCIPALPCHNTTDWLKCIKKERNSSNELFTPVN